MKAIVRRRASSFVVLFVVGLIASGCQTTCEAMCVKLVDCGFSGVSATEDECELSCESQALLYEDWEDKDAEAAFDAQRLCIAESTCEDLEAGVCYDPALHVF